MKFYSTKHQSPETDLKTAVIQGLPTDNGLYMPENIRPLSRDFFRHMHVMDFPTMANQVAQTLLRRTINPIDLGNIVHDAINFDAPLVHVHDNVYCLELFHGPSAAFKDFGARFMAKIMGHYVAEEKQSKTLYILVATSGDTGGAVAQGFLGTPGIEVIILYPSGKISELQEKQLTTLGQNIRAIEVKGTFDDCQKLVKTAFLDQDLRSKRSISSANSINLARLIPQSFYYFRAYQHLVKLKKATQAPIFSVPSGNFGNITAGLIGKRMGLPVEKFVASNNLNNVFAEYHESGVFIPRPSVPTLSNAMDVGNPSNLQRIQDLYDNDLLAMRKDIDAYYFNDEQTEATMKEVYAKHGYVMCPHTAVAYLGLQNYLAKTGSTAPAIFLGTAHPAKFLDIVEPALNQKVTIPENLVKLMQREKAAQLMDTDYDAFKNYLLSR